MNAQTTFQQIINNLAPEIKDHINKMGLPYPLVIHADSSKNISETVTEFLSDIHATIPSTLYNAIPYIIGELSDNIDQHSQYSNAYLFLKCNESDKELEIIIFDDGETIPKIFEKNNVKFAQDSLVIKMALEGKTTKKEDIKRGFGLRTTRAIVTSLDGKMKIISRKGMLSVGKSNVSIDDFSKAQLDGTLVYIKFQAPEKDLNIYPYLE